MKEEIRKRLHNIRIAHSEDEGREKSRRIKRHLFEMREFHAAEVVAFYASVNSEVFTHDMIHEALELEKRVAVPVTDWERKKLRLAEIHSLAELSKTKKGLWEPDANRTKLLRPEEVDFVVVPGIAFDQRGHRIGYGMGFYDGLLRRMRHAMSVGLAFEFQMVDELPTSARDVALKKIVTERGVINCKK